MRKLRAGVAIAMIGAAAVPAAAYAHGDGADDTAPTNPVVDMAVGLLAPQNRPFDANPSVSGSFGSPFVEPTINGQATDEKCIEGGNVDGLEKCKPAAGTNIVLPDGRILYWDNLGGTENVKYSIVGEYGSVAVNDEARLLNLGRSGTTPAWSLPSPVDGGANANGDQGDGGPPLIPGTETTEPFNDGALFGSHQSYLPDGRILVEGGTDYSLDPGVNPPQLPGLPKGVGVVELSGLKNGRIFDPKTNTFTQTGSMENGRWYPTQLSLGNGQQLVFGGVRKLLKPIYSDKPTESLQNELDVERYDVKTGKFTNEGDGAKRDLPLYPRLSLLPNGKVFYNASGQAFNPFGQSLGQVGWNQTAIYDPETHTWANGKLPGIDDAKGGVPQDVVGSGFRGSMSSTLLRMEPDADGNYTKSKFLSAGGVLGFGAASSPGSYLAVANSRITEVDTTGGATKQETHPTGPLNQPRWYGSNVVLPTGQVLTFNGADKDEVVGPGTEFPVQQTEIFDPKTEKWTPAAVSNHGRTYHNTAMLLPSGEVLIGGHATISTLYLNNTTIPGGFANHDGRDPSFEIFKPPYLFQADGTTPAKRPAIKSMDDLVSSGASTEIQLSDDTNPADVTSVVLHRNTAVTHLVDGDQRSVVVPVVARGAHSVTVKMPANKNVVPAGPYMVFVNARSDAKTGETPSVAKQVLMDAPPGTTLPGAVDGGPVSNPADAPAPNGDAEGTANSRTQVAGGPVATTGGSLDTAKANGTVKLNGVALGKGRRTMRVSLTCPAGTLGCDVTLGLKQGKRTVVKATRVKLAAGKSAKPTLRFDRKLVKALRSGRRTTLRVTAASRGGKTRTKALRIVRRTR